METCGIVLLEDSAIIRQVLVEFIDRQPDLEVVAQFNKCAEFVSSAASWVGRAGVAVVDISLPDGDGIDAWKAVCQGAGRHVPVVVFSGKANVDDVRRVQDEAAGGVGILSKDGAASLATVRQAIDSVRAGLMMVDPSIRSVAKSSAVAGLLTDQEFEVLGCIAAGASNQAIHERMYISVKRVEGLVTSIYDKLGLHNPSAGGNPRVLATLMYLGLIPPN